MGTGAATGWSSVGEDEGMMDGSLAARAAQQHFRDARRKALLAGLLDMLRHRSNRLLSLDDVRRRINVHGQHYLGHQTVPLDHVIGSEGRYSDFDRRFLPLNATLKQRWSNIGQARLMDVELPPIELYKIGDVYFVRDGNHRVSVARQQGQDFIDAFVTELSVDVPLTSDLSFRDLLLKEEYSDFLEWTNLHELRPDERIEFTELGGYLDLVQHINAHRYYLGQELGREISRDEAVTGWYDNVYMPIVGALRDQNVLAAFAGRTEGDLYRWIMEHRWYMRERSGTDPGPDAAASEYAEMFGQRGMLLSLGAILQSAFHRLQRREPTPDSIQAQDDTGVGDG